MHPKCMVFYMIVTVCSVGVWKRIAFENHTCFSFRSLDTTDSVM